MTRVLVSLLFLSALVLAGVLLEGPVRPARAEEGAPAFVGAESCKLCHFKQHRSWAKTKMARAFEALKPGQAAEAKTTAGLDPQADFTRDAKCLACHVSAYGKPGGYPDVGHAWTPEETARARLLEGVTCEACHGPGSQYGPYKSDHEAYKRADLVALGAAIPVQAETCTPCHAKECPTMGEDYAFDPAAALEQAKGSGEGTHDHVPLKHPHD
jgi:hypothetical protein